MIRTMRALGARLTIALAGELPVALRKNMMVELWVAIAYGVFYAMTLPLHHLSHQHHVDEYCVVHVWPGRSTAVGATAQ